MSNVPWFTISTFLIALSQAVAGMVGAVDADTAAMLVSASIALGGIGKGVYNIGEGMKLSDPLSVQHISIEEMQGLLGALTGDDVDTLE